MPATLTYPGVYIEEISSGVRTIAGVATSVTAFVGRAARGPLNEPVTIFNFGDFERVFGGLQADSTMSYAVRDFFMNGGGQAVIVRLFAPSAPDANQRARLSLGDLQLEAASEGAWGNALRARVDYDTRDASDANLFNLAVKDTATGQTEIFRNVSVQLGHVRQVDNVLRQESSLVRVRGALPTVRPTKTEAVNAKADLFDPANSLAVAGDGQASDSQALQDAAIYKGSQADKTGIYALDKTDLFNLLCIPPDTRGGSTANEVYQDAATYCEQRRAMLLIDPPDNWVDVASAQNKLKDLSISGPTARNAAVYFPRVRQADPLREGQIDTFAPCGIVAGVIARTDAQRGVWKAPAGLDAALNGIQGLAVNLTDDENGKLNPLGINCLRSFPVNGRVVWGARTLRGADQMADEYKYIPVRRLALYIEESLYRGTQWVVFEPNDEPLWAQIRLNAGAFMQNLFRQGAFQGKSPREAYFVKCDRETTTQNDINLGIVNILVGFAPLKPAEFVIVRLQQMAGQIAA